VKIDPMDLVGSKRGYLEIIAHDGWRNGRHHYKCRCICGTECIRMRQHLQDGKQKSCGCMAPIISARANTTHGMTKRPAYRVWLGMKQRCGNALDKNYGGRGIKVCERWMKFENFLADMGEPLTGTQLDRINNSGDYEPGNCRWVTPSLNLRNRRVNRLITFNGETRCVTEWAEKVGLSRIVINNRLRRGWPIDRLFDPVQR
jgi:hypothetical protein